MKKSTLHQTTSIVCSLGIFASTTAMAQQTNPIEIPAQPLAEAITELGVETGLNIAVNANAVEGKTSMAVRGPMTPIAALQKLLIGTGLFIRPLNGSNVVVSRNLVSQNADDEPFQLDEIVISGELIDRTLQDSQTSAAVITGESIEDSSTSDFEDIIRRTAGVTVTGAGDFAIRGVSQIGVGGAGNGATISVNVDGANLSDFLLLARESPIPTWDLEQVEVLRGPQSTQSGRNALAGAVIVRSKDPFFGKELKFRSELGAFGARRAAFAYNIGNKAETLAFRVSADVQNSDSFVENSTTGNDEIGKRRSRTYRLGVLWEPNDRLSTVVKFARQQNKRGHELIDFSLFPAQKANNSNVVEFADVSIDTINLRTTYEISSALKLQWESTLLRGDTIEQVDADQSILDTGFFVRDREQSSDQHELKFLYETDRVNGVLGFLYANYDTDLILAGTQPVVPGVTATFAQSRIPERTNMAVFGELEYDVTDHWTLVGGFRYDRERFKDTFNTTLTLSAPIPFPLPPLPAQVNISGSYQAFLPKLGVIYNFDDLKSIGFTVQRGYRAGGATNFLGSGLSFFEPEYTTNYELSYRSESADGSNTFNANAFYTRWQDQQVTIGTSTTTQFVANAGKSEYYGIEFDAKWQASANLDLSASASYVKTNFINFLNAGVNLSGNEFPDAPEFTAQVGGTYYFDNGVYVSGDASYTASSFNNVQNTVKNDGYFFLDTKLGYSKDNWEAFLYVNNLFDEEYTFGSRPSNAGTGDFRFAGQPRTFGAVVQAKF